MFPTSLCKDKRNGLSFCQIMKICFSVWLKWMLATFYYFYNMYQKQETDVGSHAFSRSEKSVFCRVLGFHREHPSNDITSSPRNLREGTDESPAGSFGAPSEQCWVQTDFIPQTSCFQVAKQSSHQPAWKFIPRSKEEEKGKQKTRSTTWWNPKVLSEQSELENPHWAAVK